MSDPSSSSHHDDLHPAAPLTPPTSGDINSRLKFFTTPLSLRGWPTWLVYLGATLGLVYILNPSFGLIELIPDNFPLIGNLDEGVAFLLMWFGVIEYLMGKSSPPSGGE